MGTMAHLKHYLLIALSLVAQSLQDDPIIDLWVAVDRDSDSPANDT
jgi:hypothetical protein